MPRWDFICSTKEDALKYMSLTSGVQAEIIPTFSAIEFYRCGKLIFSLRYNKKQKTYEVKKRKLSQSRYLRLYKNGTQTAIKLENISSDFNVSKRWIHIYEKEFDSIVSRLMKNGLSYEDAKDYTQDAYLKINNIEVKSDSAFCGIWFKRSVYDWLHDCTLKKSTHRNDEINPNDVRLEPLNYEINISRYLKNSRWVNIINMMSQGYSIIDISELTQQSWDAIFSVKQRAFKELKKILSKDYENK